MTGETYTSYRCIDIVEQIERKGTELACATVTIALQAKGQMFVVTVGGAVNMSNRDVAQALQAAFGHYVAYEGGDPTKVMNNMKMASETDITGKLNG